ncbi:MAG TPA: hypothetical protein VFB82_09435, partial [Blastocatellia bacterium]|nr:hypothetical protein [Blastocatellia bacterium]
MKKAILLSAAAAVVAAFCLGVSPATSASGSGKKEVTFTKDVASIMYNNCATCHRPNDIAPMSLLSYKEVRPWARSIKEKVVNREMPPWSPDPAYGEFTNDHRLAQKDIDTVVAWVDQGAKEGNPKDLPQMPDYVAGGGWEIGKPDAVFQMAEEHVVKPDDPDQYINFFMPTNFKEDVWVQAAEIHPGNRRVVHHVIAFIQTPQMMAKKAEDAKAKGEKLGKRAAGGSGLFYLDGNLRRVKMDAPIIDNTCEQKATAGRQPGGNGEGENEGMLLAGFAPGTGNTVYPAGTAKKLPAGSTIMFQMHYSAFRGSLKDSVTDRTKIGLILAKQAPDKMVITSAAANVT